MVHENLNSECLKRLIRVFANALPSAEHILLPLLFKSGMIFPFSLDVSSVEKILLTTLSKAVCLPYWYLSHSPIVFYSCSFPEVVILMYLFMGLLSASPQENVDFKKVEVLPSLPLNSGPLHTVDAQ